MGGRADRAQVIQECRWAIARIEDNGSITMQSRTFFKDVIKFLNEKKNRNYSKLNEDNLSQEKAEKLAAFLLEYLKQPRQAITIVMTRDIVQAIYIIAKGIANEHPEKDAADC